MLKTGTIVSPPMLPIAAIAASGLVVIVAGIFLFPLMIDEAYITYSHARNFARSGRLVHHLMNPHFSVSSPLYAALLGIGGRLGFAIPALSNVLSAASIFGSGAYLTLLCYRRNLRWAAVTSGLLLAASPVLWLTLGLETSFFLLLVLAAFYHFDRGHYVALGLLTALAVLTRAEGALFAGALAFVHFLHVAPRRELSFMAIATSLAEVAVALLFTWKAFIHFARGEFLWAAVAGLVAGVASLFFIAVTSGKKGNTPGSAPADLSQPAVARPSTLWNWFWAFSAVLIPALLYLALSSDLSLKTVFQTQKGWAAIGFTGFKIGTSFSEGLRIMVEGLLDQSAWYYLWLPFLFYSAFRLSRFRWAWSLFVWGGVYWAGAAWFDLTPFFFSYTFLVPAAALLPALALQSLADASEEWDTLRYFLEDAARPSLVAAFALLFLLLMWPQVLSLRAMVTALRAEEPPRVVQTKVAPSGRGDEVFRAVGEWLNINTPPEATVAANNVGIIGFYADREMIDFLGRLQPEVAQALQRRDLFYAIPHLLPDYIVLGEDLIIFDIWLHGDPWFTSNYRTVRRFSSDRSEKLGGKPVLVFRRVHDAKPMFEEEVGAGLIEGLELVGFAIDRTELTGGDWIRVRLSLQTTRFFDSSGTPMLYDPVLNVTAFLTNTEGEVVSERSNLDVLTTFHSEHWAEKEVVPIYTTVQVPEVLEPGVYELWVRVEEEGRKRGTRRLTSLTLDND